MPYTALQTLGWLAKHSKWERAFNVNQAFLRLSKHSQQEKPCKVIVARKRADCNKCRGKIGARLAVVFKTAPPQYVHSMKKDGKARTARVGKAGIDGMEKGGLRLMKGHMGCGMLDCKVCRAWMGMFCEDIEDPEGRKAEHLCDAEVVKGIEGGRWKMKAGKCFALCKKHHGHQLAYTSASKPTNILIDCQRQCQSGMEAS